MAFACNTKKKTRAPKARAQDTKENKKNGGNAAEIYKELLVKKGQK